jgi:dTDP-glucose 4,6-dehydratase
LKILVTGSAGVIGQSLVPYLRSKGHEVTEFDIRRDLTQDVTDRMAVDMAIVPHKEEPYDAVIHMAAQVGRITGEEHSEMSVRSNMIGTLNVARACRSSESFLINFSTSEVLGHNAEFIDGEPDILSQNGIYGLTKLAAEGILKHYVVTYGLKAISIRPYMLYGGHEVPNGVYRSAVSNFLSAAHRGEPFVAHAGCIRSWCHVSDFVEGVGIVLGNLDGFQGYAAFPIGTEEYRSMEECAEIVKKVVGRGEYTVKEPPEFLVSAVKRADFSYIQRLGFEPKIGLEEGVAMTYKWMLRAGILT